MAVRAKPNEAGIVAEKTFVSMSCPLRAWRRKAVARFDAQAELVNREEFSENEPLQFFMDGTVGESLWKFVCK
jgi:recombinational DNA repair ATPase RecF